MQYPIFIHKDEHSDYGVTIPDLPGCFSTAGSIEEAIQNAHEAIECHLEALLMDNQELPPKKSIDQHLDQADFKDAMLAMVEVDFSKISKKVTQADISLPQSFLKQIDQYVYHCGNDRSGFLVDAVMHYMAQHPRKDAGRQGL